MQMPVLDLVEHALHRVVIVNQRIANARGKACVMDEFTQAFARETEVIYLVGILSSSFRPGPFWQYGVRPLPNAH